MALTRMHHVSRRHTIGPGKLAEISGDQQRLLEALLRDAELHEAWDEVERLKAALYQQPITPVMTEPMYTPEPPKRSRKRKVKSSPPSSPDKKLKRHGEP